MGRRSRFARPDTIRVPLSEGDWLEVRKRLSARDQRQGFARLVKKATFDATSANGHQQEEEQTQVEIDTSQVGFSTVLAYLVDWSLPEFPIKGQSLDVVTDALDALDANNSNKIKAAVLAHKKAMKLERAKEKKTWLARVYREGLSDSPENGL